MRTDWDSQEDPLAALREGDPRPFEAFVRGHARTLFAFFRHQGAGTHKAEDLAQEVFLKLYHHAPRYRAQERFTAFCFRIARNVWIDDRRRSGVRPRSISLDGDGAFAPPGGASGAKSAPGSPGSLSPGSFGSSDPPGKSSVPSAGSGPADGLAETGTSDPEHWASVAEEAERVRTALQALPELHRQVFELGVVQELPYPEIASRLGIPVGTVKSRMYHAVRKLRELLEPDREIRRTRA